jgi:TRAP-type C4-dicarboxylate transport system permease small subunit
MADEAPARPPLLRRIEIGTLTILGVAITLVMFANAVLRYLFGISIIWAEEVIRIMFVWAMFIAITGAFLRNQHIGFESIALINRATKGACDLAYAACLLVVGAVLSWQGLQYTLMTGDVGLPATDVPSAVLMWPGVIAGAVWAVIGAWRLVALGSGFARGTAS